MFYLQELSPDGIKAKFYDGYKIHHKEYPLGAKDGVVLEINGQYETMPEAIEPEAEKLKDEKPKAEAAKAK